MATKTVQTDTEETGAQKVTITAEMKKDIKAMDHATRDSFTPAMIAKQFGITEEQCKKVLGAK